MDVNIKPRYQVLRRSSTNHTPSAVDVYMRSSMCGYTETSQLPSDGYVTPCGPITCVGRTSLIRDTEEPEIFRNRILEEERKTRYLSNNASERYIYQTPTTGQANGASCDPGIYNTLSPISVRRPVEEHVYEKPFFEPGGMRYAPATHHRQANFVTARPTYHQRDSYPRADARTTRAHRETAWSDVARVTGNGQYTGTAAPRSSESIDDYEKNNVIYSNIEKTGEINSIISGKVDWRAMYYNLFPETKKGLNINRHIKHNC